MKDKKQLLSKSIDIDLVYRILKNEFRKHRMPVVDLIQVQTRDPFKVLISTILSARTKDAITTEASERLFSVVNSFEDLARMPVKRIEQLIFPVGFYKTKALHLKLLPQIINALYNGKIPQTVEELVKLPGVGRKTANLVVAVGFNKPAVCVDTHVHRICNRLGYVRTKTPFETEMRLRKILPGKYWITFNSFLVSFGQNLCFPINPKCATCPIYNLCNRVGVKTKYFLRSD
jgi:endonuclease III